MARKEIIKMENVSKVYGDGETKVVALDGINLSIDEGEFVSIMGPSGSGKTTLLNMLGALGKPTTGDIRLGDTKISSVPERKLYKVRRKMIGFVFQSCYLVPTLNALENVLIPTLPMGSNKFEKRALDLLKQVGLEKRLHHRPSQLSGGEQQRVVIARALINEPRVVLADEPTGNLDSKTAQGIMRILSDLNKKEGVTLVVVTHEKEIAETADRIIHIRDGKIA
ncbi:MAG: ABC transporter ATP-binding protein [candidate division WWE3 bacterium]|nr:ABC transporter ATP-binding protein [candidate division WWE3 bacterium]